MTTDPNDYVSYNVPTPFRNAMMGIEGGYGTGMNKEGYAGAYQFGTAALNDAGMYQPSKGEDLTTNAWTGQITVPGYSPMTVQQFMANPGAQDRAFNISMGHNQQQAADAGLTDYIGKTVGGVKIDQSSLGAMIHFGGLGGTEKFLKSNGAYNPADSNGTTLSSYGANVQTASNGAPWLAQHPVQSDAPPSATESPWYAQMSGQGLSQDNALVAKQPDISALMRMQLIQSMAPPKAVAYNNPFASGPTAWAQNVGVQASQPDPQQNELMRLAMMRQNNLIS